MIIGIYQSIIIHIIFVFHDVDSLSVEIEGNVSGILGENGTEIQCSYTMENVLSITNVNIMAFNRSSVMFEQIAVYLPGGNSILTEEGQYLKGRVTLTRITQSSTRAVMIFNKLMCIDDTVYRFRVIYTDTSYKVKTDHSSNISVQVQVTPSTPDKIVWKKVNADSSATSPTVPMPSTTLSSSTAVTTKVNETISTLDSVKQSDTTTPTLSTLQTTDYNTTTYIPSPYKVSSNISYETTTQSIQQTTTSQEISEGDNITVVCTGDVGKPPAKHIFQKYRSGNILPINYTATETFISEISDNCSYYRTSNLTFQVTGDDNNARIRCVVNSSMADPDMFVQTDPLEVYYEVSEPNITKYPNKPYYIVGVDTSILLTCKSGGNPKPHYQWYKKNDSMIISTNESWTITDMNVMNSGIYICNVSNTVNGETHRKAKHVPIDIMNKDYTTRIIPEHSSTLADISTTKSSSIGSSSGVDKEEEKPEGNLGLVIGIVVAVVTVIVVIIVIIACRRRKRKSPTSKNVSNSFDDSKPKPVTETRTGDYDYIALEDDPKRKSSNNGLEVEDIIKHNEEYLKKQEEEEKKKNESNTPPQPAVYAQVNEATKSKNKPNTDSTENTDKKEEDPYAESQENIYDKAGNSRHKENENVEHFDSLSSSKQNSNGDNKQSIQTSQVGSYANQGFEKDENRKVATVSPTVRSSSGSQNDEQTNSNRNSQSKKGYENIIGTDQTGISTEESSHRTAL